MLFWVLKTYPKVYDDNQLATLELRNTLLHLILKKISLTLGIGQVNFLVTLFSNLVVND